MVDVSHDDDDPTEQFDLNIRVPGVAFDIGQNGFPKVLVVQKIADTVTEYDAARGDDEKGQREYVKNALVRTHPDDAVYQCVYLTDGPLTRSGYNDPSARYPVPESRLVPFRADRADPVDESAKWSPRDAVEHDVLESLFNVAHALESVPDADELEEIARGTGINSDVVQSAREAADLHTETLGEADEVRLDDGDGPDMELSEADDEADGESETPNPPDAPDELVDEAEAAGLDPDRVRETYDFLAHRAVGRGETPEPAALTEAALKAVADDNDPDPDAVADELGDWKP